MKDITEVIGSLSERPTLESYLCRYIRGEQLSEKDLTREVMEKLWVDEFVQDRYIAFIFDMTKERVREVRRKYGIGHKQVVQTYVVQYGSILGSIGASIMMA